MKVTKLGHCCLRIEIRGVTFLTDPGAYSTAQDEETNIDCIVISHEHTDHLHVESLKTVIKNNPDAIVVCNAAVGAILAKEGIPYTKVSHGETFVVKGVEIGGQGTLHEPIYKDYEQVENTGYFFDGLLFYPGDAFYKPDMPVDVLALPVAGPWCTIADAIEYALLVHPRVAFPVHDGNLKKATGITTRIPSLFLPPAGIEFVVLELGKETEL